MESLNTAGHILSEIDIENYMRCPQFFRYSLREQKQEKRIQHKLKTSENRFAHLDPDTRVTKWFYEQLATTATDHELTDLNYELSLIKRHFPNWVLEGLLTQQQDQAVRNGVIKLNDILQTLPLTRYSFLQGPTPLRTRTSKTPIILESSAILYSNKRYHVVCFSNYADKHSCINNHLAKIKTKFFAQYLQAPVLVHQFNCKNNVYYYQYDSSKITTKDIEIFEHSIKTMETQQLLPLVPCPYVCKFKRTCRIE